MLGRVDVVDGGPQQRRTTGLFRQDSSTGGVLVCREERVLREAPLTGPPTEDSSSAATERGQGRRCCETRWMATVLRLTETTKRGSHGMISALGGPAARTDTKSRTKATAAVKGPNLDAVRKRRWHLGHPQRGREQTYRAKGST